MTGPKPPAWPSATGGSPRRFGRRLSQPVVSGPTRLRAVLARLLRKQLDALGGRMALIGGHGDQAGIHRARIEGKRLRYLLEPLHGSRSADARKPIQHLKQAQELLGSLHDAHVLAAELKEVLCATTTKRSQVRPAPVSREGARRRRVPPSSDPRKGILALGRRLRQHRDALHAVLEREWQAGGMEQLVREVRAVAAALEAPTVDQSTTVKPPSAGSRQKTPRSESRAAVRRRAMTRLSLKCSSRSRSSSVRRMPATSRVRLTATRCSSVFTRRVARASA